MKLAYLFFIAIFLPLSVNAGLVINEIAWMGTSVSATDEWLELKNSGSVNVNLEGWTIEWRNGLYNILISSDNTDENKKCSNTTIPAGGYFLLERSDDDSVPGIVADCFYTGALINLPDGEYMILKNNIGVVIDGIDASSGWPAGDNTTKETMQKSGSGWITAGGTPKAQNSGSPQANSGEENNNTGTSTASTTESEQSNENNSSGFIDKKQFRAEIVGGDTTAIVGVEKFLEGKGFDLEGKTLTSGDFLWNFGDGAHGRGRNISHVFRYPGIYRIVFDVSSGTYNASDTIVVSVIPSPISISEVKPGTHGFIELSNTSEFEIGISYWGIGNGKLVYYFPKDTFVLPGSFLVIPYAVSSIEFPSFGSASLFYLNGIIADELAYGAVPKSDESFHDVNGISRLGLESPGSGKFVARQIVKHEAYSVSPEQSDATSYTLQDSKEENRAEVAHMDESNQAALPIAARNHFYQQFWFWFAVIIVFGILCSTGILVIRKFDRQ